MFKQGVYRHGIREVGNGWIGTVVNDMDNINGIPVVSTYFYLYLQFVTLR